LYKCSMWIRTSLNGRARVSKLSRKYPIHIYTRRIRLRYSYQPENGSNLSNDTGGKMNVHRLEALLRDAEKAHAEFEKKHGKHADWPSFYAGYIIERLETDHTCPIHDEEQVAAYEWEPINQQPSGYNEKSY
jgi:hypothetical protein